MLFIVLHVLYFTLHGSDKLHKLNNKMHKGIKLHHFELINAVHKPDTREQHTRSIFYTTSSNKKSGNIRDHRNQMFAPLNGCWLLRY